MTELLGKAVAEAANLPDDDQDVLAQLILKWIASETRWNELFAKSQDVLEKLADEALVEHRSGHRSNISDNS